MELRKKTVKRKGNGAEKGRPEERNEVVDKEQKRMAPHGPIRATWYATEMVGWVQKKKRSILQTVASCYVSTEKERAGSFRNASSGQPKPMVFAAGMHPAFSTTCERYLCFTNVCITLPMCVLLFHVTRNRPLL